MTPEAKLKKKLSSGLKKLRIFYFMPIGGPFSRSGVWDYICCINGLFVAIEVKTDKGTVSELQDAWGRTLADHGGIGYLVRGEEGVEDLLATFAELKQPVRVPAQWQ